MVGRRRRCDEEEDFRERWEYVLRVLVQEAQADGDLSARVCSGRELAGFRWVAGRRRKKESWGGIGKQVARRRNGGKQERLGERVRRELKGGRVVHRRRRSDGGETQ